MSIFIVNNLNLDWKVFTMCKDFMEQIMCVWWALTAKDSKSDWTEEMCFAFNHYYIDPVLSGSGDSIGYRISSILLPLYIHNSC